MKKSIIIPGLLIGTLLTGGLALAGSGYGPGQYDNSGRGKMTGERSYEQHQERLEHRLEKMSTILDLTDAQEEKLAELFEQRWQSSQGRREAMRSSREALHEAMASDDFDEVALRDKAAKHAELKTEMLVERAKMKQQLFAILTPEQQAKAEKLQLGMGHGKGHHGRRGMDF